MKILVVILLASAMLAGCSNVTPYMIEKDRVDQGISGNRGYLMGTPPEVPAETGVRKRTFIGIDINIPILPGEEGYEPSKGFVSKAEMAKRRRAAKEKKADWVK